MKTLPSRSALWTVLLLLGILIGSASAQTDLFTAITEIADEVAPVIGSRPAAVGPIWNAFTGRMDRVGHEAHDELVQAFATRGATITPLARNNQAVVLERVTAVDYVVNEIDLTGLNFLTDYDVLIVGSIDKWGRDFIIKVRAYELPGMRPLGGASKYLARNAMPSDYVQDAFDMDNPSDERMYDAGRADYESTALAAGYGTIPSVQGNAKYALFENKISNFVSFAGLIAQFHSEDEASGWGMPSDTGLIDEYDGLLFTAATRFYPFYKGRGMRGFFFGGGVGMGSLEMKEWEVDSSGIVLDVSDLSITYLFFEFGRKIVIGESLFIEPAVQMLGFSDDEGDSGFLGWLGLSAGMIF